MELKATQRRPLQGPPLVDHSDRPDAGKMFLRLAGVTTPAPSGAFQRLTRKTTQYRIVTIQ